MNNGETCWDLTLAADGEMYDESELYGDFEESISDDDFLSELYNDPEFLADMEARRVEALEHQMVQDALENHDV